VTRQLQGKPTLTGEIVNNFLTGKSFILGNLFFLSGCVLMEVCGRELITAKEKILEMEYQRIERLEREIERRRR
jgi:hypothetical protein